MAAIAYYGCLVLVAGLFCFCLWKGWGRRGDVIVDFGREVYLPWQVSKGRVLYRDLAHLFGPLAVYTNAVIFRLAGASLRTLYLTNAFLLAAFSCFLFLFLRRAIGKYLAISFIALFFLLLAFSHIDSLGNYNYITPYSHELLYGIYLSVVSLCLLKYFLETRRLIVIGVLGFFGGAVLLLKSEVFFALMTSELVFLVLAVLPQNRPLATTGKWLSVYLLGFSILPVVFIVYFSRHMELYEAINGMTLMYQAPFHRMPEMDIFYGQMTGLLQFRQNMHDTFLISLCVNAFVLAAPFLYGIMYSKPSLTLRFCAFMTLNASVVAILILASVGYDKVIFYSITRLWPLLLFAALMALVIRYLRSDSALRLEIAWLMACCIFSLSILAKIFLATVFTYYGAFLVLPALILYYIFIAHTLPNYFCKTNTQRNTARLPAIAIMFMIGLYSLNNTLHNYTLKSQKLHGINDAIYMKDTSSLQSILNAVKALVQDGDSLAIFPEGVMLNYLSNTSSSVKHYDIMPVPWHLFGADSIMQSLSDSQPTWILMLMRTASEYGHTYLCQSYGQDVCDFLSINYSIVREFGQTPFSFGDFGAVLYRQMRPGTKVYTDKPALP